MKNFYMIKGTTKLKDNYQTGEKLPISNSVAKGLFP